MAEIEVKNLTKDYGSGRGVFDVSFSVSKGECFGFLGPNGAGKSTTIRHLMGFSKPDKGECLIQGKNSFDEYSEVLHHVGYIPGEISLPAGLSGYEFLKMEQDLQGIHNEEKQKELLQLFDLEDNVLKGDTKRMSLGVKRKLAIVSAFQNDPDILILDEPTSGLDPLMQRVFVSYIEKEKAKGKTILLSSHIFSEVDATCERIGIIKDGKIVSIFNANDLKHASKKFYEVGFKNNDELERFTSNHMNSSVMKILDVNKEKKSLFISAEDKDINSVIAHFSHYDIASFTNKKESLQEYFMKFYKEDQTYGGDL
ncbi:MAG: ATP-binding cassette domain-containing protein [Bacilli bacterium]|jgi:ABC-2 type transport system ATP-binding protein|nr:ATP-binding cassette domain-containing protein [Bacilli bacterium]MCI2055378.1 ATP-binding cassette domain-containing protein [Bacilli bacterium]